MGLLLKIFVWTFVSEKQFIMKEVTDHWCYEKKTFYFYNNIVHDSIDILYARDLNRSDMLQYVHIRFFNRNTGACMKQITGHLFLLQTIPNVSFNVQHWWGKALSRGVECPPANFLTRTDIHYDLHQVHLTPGALELIHCIGINTGFVDCWNHSFDIGRDECNQRQPIAQGQQWSHS